MKFIIVVIIFYALVKGGWDIILNWLFGGKK